MWRIFRSEYMSLKTPQQPYLSPQIHHVFTTICTPKLQKPAAKRRFHHRKLNSPPKHKCRRGHDRKNPFLVDAANFTSVGWQSPTMTILASSMYASEYLATEMSKQNVQRRKRDEDIPQEVYGQYCSSGRTHHGWPFRICESTWPTAGHPALLRPSTNDGRFRSHVSRSKRRRLYRSGSGRATQKERNRSSRNVGQGWSSLCQRASSVR
jgi:hypothetical protein